VERSSRPHTHAYLFLHHPANLEDAGNSVRDESSHCRYTHAHVCVGTQPHFLAHISLVLISGEKKHTMLDNGAHNEQPIKIEALRMHKAQMFEFHEMLMLWATR